MARDTEETGRTNFDLHPKHAGSSATGWLGSAAKFTRKMSDGPEVMEEDEYTKLTHAERAFVDAAKALVDLSKVIDPDLLLAWTATGAGGMKHDVDRRMVAIVAAARGEEERVPGVFANKLDPPKSEPEVATGAELSADLDEIDEIRARLEKKIGEKNLMTTNQEKIAADVLSYANEKFDVDGWDFVAMSFTIEDVVEKMGKAKTLETAIRNVQASTRIFSDYDIRDGIRQRRRNSKK